MNKYDAVIIGAGIAGLGVGGLLQDKGMKTLVLDRGEMPGGRTVTFDMPGGWRLDRGIHCVDMGIHSTCAKLLKELGIDIPWSRNLEGFKFYDDQGRWQTMSDYLNLNREEAQELVDFQQWVKNADDELIDKYDNISLAQLIAERVKSQKVAEFIKTTGMIHTTLTEAEIISAGEFIYIYRDELSYPMENNFPFYQVRIPKGGSGNMTKAMAEAYEKKGGTLRLGTDVKKVNVLPGNATQIVIENETLTAPIVVIAMPIWDMLKIMPMDEMAKLAPEWAERMRHFEFETSAAMGYTIGVKEPLYAGPYYLSAWRIPGVGLPLQLLGHTNLDETISPPNHMLAVMGACLTPAQAMDDDFRKKALDAFWVTINEMFPNLKDNLLWQVDSYSVGIDGLSRSPGMTGRYRPKVYLPEVPGLYFAGDCYSGRGIGMNMAADSAMICVKEIMSRQGK